MARRRGQGRPQRGRGGGGRANGAPRNRGALGLHARPSSHSIAKSFQRTKKLPWQKNLMEDGLRAAGLSSGLDNGTSLYISNLDLEVSNDDIRELFSEIGELIRYAIHYDKYGRASGSAEVVFAKRSDAMKAFKRYNNVLLDGRPMKIEVVGKAEFSLSNGSKVLMNQAPGPSRTRGATAVAVQGFSQSPKKKRGRGRGRDRRKKAFLETVDDLDMEVEN